MTVLIADIYYKQPIKLVLVLLPLNLVRVMLHFLKYCAKGYFIYKIKNKKMLILGRDKYMILWVIKFYIKIIEFILPLGLTEVTNNCCCPLFIPRIKKIVMLTHKIFLTQKV